MLIYAQGSAVTQHPGTYVLQWKFFDSSKASFELLAPHKAKVMYYTELIQSEKFRYCALRFPYLLVRIFVRYFCGRKQTVKACRPYYH